MQAVSGQLLRQKQFHHSDQRYERQRQEDRALALLKLRGQLWTPAPELAEISLQYCRVIACLRKRGYRIDNRVEILGTKKHGFYRLASEPAALSGQTAQPAGRPVLFGDIAPDRSYAE